MSAQSFFPWLGGKSKLAPRLCQLLPAHRCYIEVFAGAANLLFTKPPSKAEILNDRNSELTNLFRVVRCHPRAFIDELQFQLHSRQDFADYKAQPGLTDIQQAARSWYIIKTAFGGGGKTTSNFGYSLGGRSRFRRSVFSSIRRCSRRLDGVTIENLDFADCITRYDRPDSLFYCDPPYLATACYQVSFDAADHDRLAQALKTIKGKFLLSINDHPQIRKLYRGFPCRKIPVKYSVSRDKSPQASERTELIIANFPLPRQR